MKKYYGFCAGVAFGPLVFWLAAMLVLALAGCEGGEGSGLRHCRGVSNDFAGGLQILSLVALFASPFGMALGAVLAVAGKVFQRARA